MSKDAPIQSLVRGMEILRFVGRNPQGVTVGQIAEHLDCKSPTAHHLIKTFLSGGFLEKVSKPIRYRLGPEIGRLASIAQPDLAAGARDLLLECQKRLSPVTLTWVEDPGDELVNVFYLYRFSPGRIDESRTRPVVPYASAASLIFQAYWPAQRLAAYRQRYPFYDYGAHIWKREELLDEYLEQVREKAVAYSDPDSKGWLRISVPVFDEADNIYAALNGFAVPEEHGRRKNLDNLIESALHKIVKSLTG